MEKLVEKHLHDDCCDDDCCCHEHEHDDDCCCDEHEHHHDHDGGCSCCHAPSLIDDDDEEEEEEETPLWQLVLGTIIFLITYFTALIPEPYDIAAYGVAYIVLGNTVIKAAFYNILHKEPFDENLLMVIASGGAFLIGDYPEAVAVMLFSRIGETMEDKAADKSRHQIREAVDMRPETIQRVTADGSVETVPASDGAVGDIVVVRVGDRIPLDGVVVDGDSLVDTSALTGEPVPVHCTVGSDVMSGCINTSAVLHVRVTKPLAQSAVTKILEAVEKASARKPKIDRFITRFSHVYTPAVVAIAAATAIVPSLVTGNWHYWIYTALTFLVISCPCALVLSVPLSFFAGIGAGSKQGILFKGGIAIEQMKRIGAVVFDKTGTITKGNFVVQRIEPVAGVPAEDVLRLCASAEQASSHPIAKSVLAKAADEGLELSLIEEAEEIAGEGLKVRVAGAEILCGNGKLMEHFHISLPDIPDENYGSELYVAKDGAYIGHIIISDTLKADATEAIKAIKGLGITTAILTGDSQAAADYVAKEAGIDVVRAKLMPQDKVDQLDALRKAYGPVLFVGDGINDAPVLAGADVGAAMGSGADAAVEAADVVFMNSTVSAVPEALRISRFTMSIATQNIIFALGVKAIVMLAGFAGYASMWAAVFADSGVAALCVVNSVRALYKKA